LIGLGLATNKSHARWIPFAIFLPGIALLLMPAVPASAESPVYTGVSSRLRSLDSVTDTELEHSEHPELRLVSAMVPWSALEPSEGQFDWTQMDSNVQAARDGGYRLIVRIMAGRASPSWLVGSGAQELRLLGTDANSDDYCDWVTTPVPWDPVLAQKYTDLMRDVGRWLREPDGAGGTKADHVYLIPISMPSFLGTEMVIGYGSNTTCPAGTDGAGESLRTTNVARWNSVSTVDQRRSWTEQAWRQAIDIHMAELPAGTNSLLAYGHVFEDGQAAALRIATDKVAGYPERLWSTYTNLQPAIHADGTFGPWREWCPACHNVIEAAIAAGGAVGLHTAATADTWPRYQAAVEDGLATYPAAFLETQPDLIDRFVSYLLTDTPSVQDRLTDLPTMRATTTSVACGPSVLGEETTCTATVSEVYGVPPGEPSGNGAVTWSSTGSGTLSSSSCTPVGGSGTSSCSVTYLPSSASPSSISATYIGDGSHLVSDGSTTVTPSDRSSSTTVACAPSSDPLGVAATCTATVSDMAGSGSVTPTGSVTWSSSAAGTFSDGSCALAGTGGTSACSVSYTPAAGSAGAHVISSSYGGDGAHSSSTGTVTLTATTRASSTVASCAPTSVQLSVSTTCTATVNDTTAGAALTPTGNISWSSSGAGSFSPASCSLGGSGASSCSVTYTASVAGVHQISAVYPGDANHAGSDTGSSPATVTVSSDQPPTVTLTSPLNNASVPKGKTIAITATASDDVRIVSVKFSINGGVRCTDTTAPYSCSWPVPKKAGVSYIIKATATDTAGQTASSSVTVTAR
jgi:Bacterial Ig domain/Bacterial Ig-like domain (group 3)/Beta-galactosidase